MTEKKENNIDSTNIFDEFSWDENLKKEVEKIKTSREKNSYYYLRIISKFLKFFNTTFILLFIVLWVYIYIQNDETIKNTSYLDPVCNLFVESTGEYSNCSSVSGLLDNYNNKYKNKEELIYKYNLSLVWDVYSIWNFVFSKDISFLLDRTNNKIRPLEILEEFDKLKNEFEPINKSRIRCFNVLIDWDYNLEISCSAYSWSWDSKILWFSWENTDQNQISGTSISRASSFINFLEKKDKSKFILLNKQKTFEFIEIVDDEGYTRKTDFKLKLKFKNNNIWL